MRFNSYLVEVANEFRDFIFNSSDELDGTERPLNWQDETVRTQYFFHQNL